MMLRNVKTMLSCMLFYVQLWALETGKLLCTLDKHTGPINSLQFHPSELLLASGSSDRYADHHLLFNNLSSLKTLDCNIMSPYK